MTTRYEIQHNMATGWANTWTETIGGIERPVTFASYDEAQAELDSYLVDDAVTDDDHMHFNPEDFRIMMVRP